MPRKAIDYSNCKFYRLVCKDVTVKEVYVGHTTDEKNRRNCHKTRCTNAKRKHYNFFVYKFIRDHGSWDNWQLIVHETLAVENKAAAVLRERFWLEHYNATLNSNVPGQTQAEYYVAHVDEIKVTQAAYRSAHVVEIKAYRAAHVDKIKAYQATYNAAHVDEKKVTSAAHYVANADHLKEKHACECGGKYTTANHGRHLRTARHCTYITAQAAL